MKPNEIKFRLWLSPEEDGGRIAVLAVVDGSMRSNSYTTESGDLLRVYANVYLGHVDDTEQPTMFYFDTDSDDIGTQLPITEGPVGVKEEILLTYGRNWDGCQHVDFEEGYYHICDSLDWKLLCAALHELPEWTQELLGSAYG